MKADLTPYVRRMRLNPHIGPHVLDFFLSPRDKYLLGAGAQAAVCLSMFRDMGLPVAGLLLDICGNRERLRGYWGRLLRAQPLYRLENFPSDKEAVDVLITVDASRYPAARSRLLETGFPHVYTCDWGSNMNIKTICLDVYQERLQALQGL